jgi:hypothetical protein
MYAAGVAAAQTMAHSHTRPITGIIALFLAPWKCQRPAEPATKHPPMCARWKHVTAWLPPKRFVSGDFYYAREHLWGFPEAMQIYALRAGLVFAPKLRGAKWKSALLIVAPGGGAAFKGVRDALQSGIWLLLSCKTLQNRQGMQIQRPAFCIMEIWAVAHITRLFGENKCNSLRNERKEVCFS